MSDIALRMTLVDDVSNKLNKIATSGKNVATQLATAGKEIDKAFQTKSPDTFVSKVGKAMSEAEKEVESLGSTIDSIDASFSSKSGHWDISNSGMTWIDDVAEQAEEAGKSMDKASNSAKKLKDDLSGVGDDADGLSDVGDDAEELGESMSSASGQVVDFSGALKTLFGVAVGAKVFGEVKDYISSSIEVGKDYTSMISEVAAISGATGSDLDLMEESARKWGATTVFSASDAAEALKYMSLAGWSAQQSTSALGGVLNLAAASGMGLGEASDMVTDYLSAFGMEASKSAYFADMLAYAQSNSNTTAAQLGEAYRNSAANLHAAGQDVETTTSLLEAMANQGYKGSEAGTALAATMRDITQKMEDGNIQIGDTSVAVQDSQGNFRDLTDILMDVENATDGMGDAQKAAALGSTFTSDSIKALNMILTEGMDKVSGYEKALRSASGTSDQMAGTMNDNLSGDMANMQSALEEMQLQSFEALEEPLRGFVQYATNDVIPTLTEWVPEAVGSLADGVSELGQALSPIFETIIKNPEAVGNAFISMAAGLTALKAVNTGFKIADVDNHGKTFSTASTTVSGVTCDTYISTMPWNTGGCDNVLGTCGSPTSNTSGKEPYILFGVEMSTGFWEPKGNTVMKIENHVMRAYICYDCTKMTTAGATTADWVAVGYEIPDCKESWKYIAKLGYDADNPEVRYPVAVGATSSTGYACACCTNNLETTGDGQREILGSGNLYHGSYVGRRLALLNAGLSGSVWSYAARLSASGRCGRKAA